MNLNLETDAKPHMVKINAKLENRQGTRSGTVVEEFKDFFAWTYKDIKGIPPKLN
jgi:hypothetical protein